MTHDSGTTRHKGGDRPAPTGDYEVGYCRPPVHTRIKPGEVRNPGGRRKGERHVMTELLEILNEKVKIKEGSRMRKMTKSKALLLKLVNDAAMGDAKSQANLIALLRGGGKLAAPDVTPSHQVSVSSDDEGLVADFLARNRDTPWVFDPYAPTAPKQEG